jgi:tetratricopeptide (TPR) repeat protein
LTLSELSLLAQKEFAVRVVELLHTEGAYAEALAPPADEAENAAAYWRTLSEIDDIDELRGVLSGTRNVKDDDKSVAGFRKTVEWAEKFAQELEPLRAANAAVAALLYRELVTAFGHQLDSGTALNLAQWLLFIEGYCGDHSRFEVVGTLLQGLARYANGDGDSRNDFAVAAQRVRETDAPAVLRVAAFSALAHDLSGGGLEDKDVTLALIDEAAVTADGEAGLAEFCAYLHDWITRRGDLTAKIAGGDELVIRDVLDQAVELDLYRPLWNDAVGAGAQGHVDEAVRLCRSLDLMALDLGFPAEHAELLGKVLVQHSEWVVGVALLRSACALGDCDGEARLLLARGLTHQGLYDEAQEVLCGLTEDEPENSDAWRDLGLVFHAQNQNDAAAQALMRALELKPEDQIAKMALDSLRPAAVAYDPEAGSMTVDPDLLGSDPETLAVMMVAAMIKSMPGELEQNLQQMVGEKDSDFVARVRAAIEDGQPAAGTDDPLAQAQRLFRERRFDEAKLAYAAAIAQTPNDPYPYMGLGDCHYMMGDFYLAAAFFEESIAIKPSPSTWRFLGDAYRKTGRMERAEAAYESALALDPSYEIARQQLQAIRATEAGP